MENNIEQIILTKEYDALNNAELAAISEYISSEEEYLQVRDLLIKLKSSHEEIIKPDPAIKSLLAGKFHSSSSLKVVKDSGSLAKANRKILWRLSYAAMITAGLIITFLLIKNSGKKEYLIVKKSTHNEQKDSDKHLANEATKAKEQNENPTIQNNNDITFSINKQAAILKNDTIAQNNIAMMNINKTQNQNTKKGRTLSEDLAVMDVMYVAL